MRRRSFIAGLGSASVALPIIAQAQQSERTRRIGVLMTLASDDKRGQTFISAFVERLQQLGWTNGGNAQIDIRWGGGDADRIRRYATELVALAPDAILTVGAVGLAPLLQVTRSVPIVFVVVPNPVSAGFVESLGHPGGNATGFLMFEYALSGLISYGPDFADQYRQAARYIDRVLKGEAPADLPVQAPSKYAVAINLGTAKALGLAVPPALLARADEVIE